MMNRLFFVAILAAGLSLYSTARALDDDAATVALYHFESIDEGFTPPISMDDDSQHTARDLNIQCTIPGTYEVAPEVVAGYVGSAVQFAGNNCLRSPSSLWQSSYTEFKIDFMIYVTSLPYEFNEKIAYIFDVAPVWQLDIWSTWNTTTNSAEIDQDYMRFSIVYSDSTKLSHDIPFPSTLKNQWIHVVGSYDASKNYVFSFTPVGGSETRYTTTGTKAMKSASGGFDMGFKVGYSTTNRGFRGMIDELKISNYVTTPHYAFWPIPSSGSTVYTQPDTLAWSKGLVALGSDVFFGTSSSAVAAATKPALDIDGDGFIDFGDFAVLAGQWQTAPSYPSADVNKSGLVNGTDLYQLISNWLTSTTSLSPLYLGSTTGTTIGAPALIPSTTYYWRADSVNISENTKGNTWSFITGSAAASSPTPSTGATSVAVDANTVTLKWVPGFRATSYNLYFGTSSNPPLFTTLSQTSCAKAGLAPNTKYYWRIETVSPFGTFAGTVWDFTTGTILVTTPSPADTATGVTFPLVGVDLSWSCVFAPARYDVYFGTQASPPCVGSSTMPKFRSPAVAQNATYYWRIDCVSVFGTVTGTTWSFSTATPAFPQAEGFGRFAKGGRGGDVYHVTTLSDSSTPTAGMLRYGIDNAPSTGRTIVFDVGGYINLVTRLKIEKSNITIAGQTAPGAGIGLSGYGVNIGDEDEVNSYNDIIIRYIRFRNTAASADAVTVFKKVNNLIFDHVSSSWGVDEVFSIRASTNITVQWSMITEGTRATNHSKGSLLEMPVLSMHHCIYAHNDDRNPKSKGTFDYRNNVVWNWGMAPFIAGGGTSAKCYANCVGNYYIAGPDTTNPNYMVISGNGNYSLYLSDNRIDSNRNGILDGVDLGIAMVDPAGMPTMVATPYEFPPVTTSSPEVAYTQVLANAGCSLSRDSIDTRIVNDIQNQTGWILTSYTDRGGLGTLTGGTAPLDTDQDGMPDAWEDAHGLSKTNAADGATVGADGYTNLENYLNSLAVYP